MYPEEQADMETQATQDSTVLGSEVNSDNLDWKSSLPSDLANDPTIAQFKDVESLAKTVVHQQKQMGSRIPLPKTDDEYKELYGKLGRPDEPAGYEMKVPEGMDAYFNDNIMGEFRNVAHNIGLSQNQVNALMEYQANMVTAEIDNQPSILAAQKEETESVLKQEWGIDYDKNIRAAQRALQVYGDPEIMELMNTTAGNKNTQNNNLATSRLDAQDEISDIYSNPEHPYFNGSHPDHRAAVEKVRQLHEKVYGR